MSYSKRVPTFVLAAGVLGLAAADWMVLTSVADGPDEAKVIEAPAPAKLPDGAFLTGKQTVNRTVIDGMVYTIARAGKLGYSLKLHNPTDAAASINCDVQSYVTEGSRRGRMMPSAQLKQSEPLTVSFAAGASHDITLAFADPAPKADAKVRKGWFRTVSFQLRGPAPKAVPVSNGKKAAAPQGELLGEIRYAVPAAKAEAPKTVETRAIKLAVLEK
jgi:hypothetical protein